MNVLERLRGGLIVSVQAAPGSALDDPYVLAAMARAAVDAGAVAVRIQGIANLEAVRRRVDVPIVGLIKADHPGFEPYITATIEQARAILATGAEVVAFDATGRARPDGSATLEMVEAVHGGGALAMADCARAADGTHAARAGADILATTLRGYTKETAGAQLPALDALKALRRLGKFVICEGGIHRPEQGSAALAAGADAIVVGTAITNVSWLVREFSNALDKRSPS
ncbi:MAG TPA: putative N-acetylmannosamine-6-phosphate 2-epimerase [Candidatus Baltobacteraceae bacterium]